VIASIAGLVIVTFGFFAAHAIASAWIGRRALKGKAQASSLYLFCCYSGASVLGSTGGWLWSAWNWGGVVALVGAGMLVALAGSLWLSRLKPLAAPLG
jgi:YNFM family putative membrane transporter